MTISNFDELLSLAAAQAEPQTLLLVFTAAELPADCTPAQRTAFESGEGGALVPLMCVDKSPDQLTSFNALIEEASLMKQDWQFVFAAALSGQNQGRSKKSPVDVSMQRMVEAIRAGDIGNFIPFDKHGQAVALF